MCPSCRWQSSIIQPALNTRAISSSPRANERRDNSFNLDDIVASLGKANSGSAGEPNKYSGLLSNLSLSSHSPVSPDPPRHQMHVYATKHNTHITFSRPEGGAILSLSTGNLGLRKGARGDYDAAYQLAAYSLKTLKDKGELAKIQRCELVFRDFGPGREAVTKALQGSEGRLIRNKIVAVTDATRLKQGGIRSRKPRRLG